jgi:hypothetical protein
LPEWIGQDIAYPTLRYLLAMTPAIIGFVIPPRALVRLFVFHLDVMFVAPTYRIFLLCVFYHWKAL